MHWSSIIKQAQSTPAPSENVPFFLAPITDMGLIHVQGQDALSFLQNMFTNDVTSLNDNQAQLNGLCNPKGRLLAIFVIIKRGNHFFLWLPNEIIDLIIQRLTMFKLRSNVELTKTDNLHVIGSVGQHQGIANITPVSIPSHPELSLFIISESELENISTETLLVNESYWRQAWILSGLPMVFKPSYEAFTPQQVNLDLVGGVSFKKGCYPGQEVVARLHYLGKPSRRLFLATLSGTDLPEVNTEVLSQSGDVLGHIVNAVEIEGNVYCQLSLKLDKADIPGFVLGQPIQNLKAFVIEEN